MSAPNALAELPQLDVRGWRLSGMRSDPDAGLVLTLEGPAGDGSPRARRTVGFPTWAHVDALRPSFGRLRAFEVSRSEELVEDRLAVLPDPLFSAAEREAMRRVTLFEQGLAAPVVDLLAADTCVDAESPPEER